MQFGREKFTFRSHVADIAVDFKKLVSELFRTGFALVESEYIKGKTRSSEQQYSSNLQCGANVNLF